MVSYVTGPADLFENGLLGGIDVKQFVQMQDLNQFGAKWRQTADGQMPLAFLQLVPGTDQYAGETCSKELDFGKVNNQVLTIHFFCQILDQTSDVPQALLVVRAVLRPGQFQKTGLGIPIRANPNYRLIILLPGHGPFPSMTDAARGSLCRESTSVDHESQ